MLYGLIISDHISPQPKQSTDHRCLPRLISHFIDTFFITMQKREDKRMAGFDEDTTITLGFALGSVVLILFIAVWTTFYYFCCRFVHIMFQFTDNHRNLIIEHPVTQYFSKNQPQGSFGIVLNCKLIRPFAPNSICRLLFGKSRSLRVGGTNSTHLQSEHFVQNRKTCRHIIIIFITYFVFINLININKLSPRWMWRTIEINGDKRISLPDLANLLAIVLLFWSNYL